MSMRVSDPIWDPYEHQPDDGPPVPWVARWTEETGTEHATTLTLDALDHELRIQAYPASHQGKGTPQYGAVDTYRGIRCFQEGRCQVCGALVQDPFTIINASHPITFIGAEKHEVIRVLKELVGKPLPVYDMPVCDTCLPLAVRECPQVKRNVQTKMVVRGPFTAYGAMIGPPGLANDQALSAEAFEDAFRAGLVIKQLMVSALLVEVME